MNTPTPRAREIKFRAWDKRQQVMRDWNYLINQCNASRVLSWMRQEDEDKIISQYTGLKDKNKVPIYEGDILKNVNHFDKERLYDVHWNQELCRFDLGYEYDIFYRSHEKMVEVVGNIYENPDLINIT